jgi:hypothetical protein
LREKGINDGEGRAHLLWRLDAVQAAVQKLTPKQGKGKVKHKTQRLRDIVDQDAYQALMD